MTAIDEEITLKDKEGEESSSLRVLNVEDNDTLRRLTERKSAFQKIEFSSAASGDEALDILRNNPGLEILYSDVQMPGMNGIDLAREVKKIKPNMVVILTSGYLSSDEQASLKEEGVMDLYISKPHSISEFNDVLSEASELVQANDSSSVESKIA